MKGKLMRRIAAKTVVALAALAIFLTATLSAAAAVTNTNDPAYWETQTTHEASCYKHEGDAAHGVDNGDGSVTLNPYNQAWPGDHWELLVVKSGSVDYGYGPGNAVYDHPTAGVPYFGPLNAGGEQGQVSHWIACKGTTPPTTTTTVVTTTTVPPSTTTTTTVPTTTSTVPPSTTTAPPVTTTTVTVPPTTTVPPPTTVPPTTVPPTTVPPTTVPPTTVPPTTVPPTTMPPTTLPPETTTTLPPVTTTIPDPPTINIDVEVQCDNTDKATDKTEQIVNIWSGTYTVGSTDEFDVQITIESPVGNFLPQLDVVALTTPGRHDNGPGYRLNDVVRATAWIAPYIDGVRGEYVMVDQSTVDCSIPVVTTTTVAPPTTIPVVTLPVTGPSGRTVGIGIAGLAFLFIGGALLVTEAIRRDKEQ